MFTVLGKVRSQWLNNFALRYHSLFRLFPSPPRMRGRVSIGVAARLEVLLGIQKPLRRQQETTLLYFL